MDSYQYEAVRKRYPELQLWPWIECTPTLRHRVKSLTVRQLISFRAAKLLKDDPGTPYWGRTQRKAVRRSCVPFTFPDYDDETNKLL